VENVRPGTILHVYDLTGRQIQRNVTGSDIATIQVSSLSAGIYILHAVDRQGNFVVRRFVVE